MTLAICCSTIEAHGGRLWTSTTSHADTTFQLTVSAAEGKLYDENA